MLRAHVQDEAFLADRVPAERRVPVATGDGVDPPLGGPPGRAIGLAHRSRLQLLRVAAGVAAAPLVIDSAVSDRAVRSWRPCTRPGCRPAGSPCVAGSPPSRPAS